MVRCSTNLRDARCSTSLLMDLNKDWVKELEENDKKRQEEFEAYKAQQEAAMESFTQGIRQELLNSGIQ